jgi:hypothetical protein
MDTEDLEKMVVEVTSGKPYTVKGEEAAAMYTQLEKEIAEIIAEGHAPCPHHEIPYMGKKKIE